MTKYEHVFQESEFEVLRTVPKSDQCAYNVYIVKVEDWQAEAAHLLEDDTWMLFLFYEKDPFLVHWPIVQFTRDDKYHGPFSILEVGEEKEAGFHRQKTDFNTMINLLKRLKKHV